MPKKILIAEDDSFLVKMYKLELGEEGFEVEVAKDGEKAIESMDKQQPDILLLDLLMPKVDGFKVLEHINEKKYKFPVVVFSNLSQDVDKKKCEELGAEEYFVKSDMDIQELSKKIKKYL